MEEVSAHVYYITDCSNYLYTPDVSISVTSLELCTQLHIRFFAEVRAGQKDIHLFYIIFRQENMDSYCIIILSAYNCRYSINN